MVNYIEIPKDPEKLLRKYGYADGNYFTSCGDCGEKFIGDKRAYRCFACAKVLDEEEIPF